MKPFNPESFLINAIAAKTVSRLSAEECKRWLTEVVKNYECFVKNRDYQPSFTDDLVGDLVKQTWSAQQAGLEARWKKHYANPSGKGAESPEG